MDSAQALKAGGTVGVFAPGSPANPERCQRGLKKLHKLGYKSSVPLDPAAFYGKHEHGFASESPAARADALHRLLQDDAVSVLIAARGAYGSLELLPLLDFALIRRSRKLIVGYSDVSSLLLPVWQQAGLYAVHGPTISKEFAEFDDNPDSRKSVEELLELLSKPSWRFARQAQVLRAGSASGTIAAANLTALMTLLGTPWEPELKGCILFLEDVGEAPFRVQRALQQLLLAGKLDSLAALVFGRFDRCQAPSGPSVDDVFDYFVSKMLANTSYPVLKNFPFGHNGLNIPLPLGCRAAVESDLVTLLESPLGGEG